MFKCHFNYENLKLLQNVSQQQNYDLNLEELFYIWKKYSDDLHATTWTALPNSKEELNLAVAKAILNYYR
jgi:hypothetical protein